MGIGPQLPPHLQRAKSQSPPPVAGPQLPPSIGPAIPAHLLGPQLSTTDDQSDEDSAPPPPPARPVAGPSLPPSASSSSRVLGPQLPPDFDQPQASTSAGPRRETPLSAAYSDDSDDDFGPMPLPAGVGYNAGESEGVRAFREREEREREAERKKKANEGKLTRDEWMIVPPENMGLLASMDSTKLKARSFNTSAKMGTADKPKNDGVNLWTETPQERQQRLQDEMLGKKRKAAISGSGSGPAVEEDDASRRKRMRDQALKDEVERHNKASRNSSLYDSHAKAKAKEPKEKQEGNLGIWDRDRDLSVTGRQLDAGKRNEMVRNARDLGGRFGGGSYL